MRLLTISIRQVGAVLMVTAALWLAGSGGVAVAAQSSYGDAAGRALDWVKGQQQPDGSFPGFGAGSTIDALLAIVASGQDPASWAQGGNSPIAFLQSKAADIVKAPGGAGKLLLAVEAAGLDGQSFGGLNLVQAVNGTYNAETGQYGPDAIGHAFSILGLRAAEIEVPQAAVSRLLAMQTVDGGWAFTGETEAGKADTNTTAVALQALLAAGANEPAAMEKAMAYLETQRNADGGFPYQKEGEFGGDSDVNSTSYVVQAMLAVGNQSLAEGGQRFLVSMQNPSGAFRWKASEQDDNAGATYQAIPPLLGATLVQPVGLHATSGVATGGQPGMPRTGQPDLLLPLALGLGAVALAAGAAVRRRAAQGA